MTNEALLLVTLALQIGSLLYASSALRTAEQANDTTGTAILRELQRRQVPLSIVFMLAAAAGIWWRVVDAYVVAFAMGFVLAQVVHAALLTGRHAEHWSPLALRASGVALIGLIAMLALDILPPQADTMVVP